MLSRLGLSYDCIGTCRNGCVLYRHEYAEINTYPMCKAARYRNAGLLREPVKVLRHFPLGPRQRRMFSTPQLATLMIWHVENMSTNGRMRGPFDSLQWLHVREKHADSATDSRNIHLGMCAGGINPHSQKDQRIPFVLSCC